VRGAWATASCKRAREADAGVRQVEHAPPEGAESVQRQEDHRPGRPSLKASNQGWSPGSAPKRFHCWRLVAWQQPRRRAAGSQRQQQRPGDSVAPGGRQQARKGLELRIKMRL